MIICLIEKIPSATNLSGDTGSNSRLMFIDLDLTKAELKRRIIIFMGSSVSILFVIKSSILRGFWLRILVKLAIKKECCVN